MFLDGARAGLSEMFREDGESNMRMSMVIQENYSDISRSAKILHCGGVGLEKSGVFAIK